MKFEVAGIGYPNKGAELMLCAVGEAIQREYGREALIASVPDSRSDTGFRCIGLEGYHMRFSLVIQGRDFGPFVSKYLPTDLLRSYGCVAQHEIDCVFDASGLRYCDQWGPGTMQRAIRDYKRVKRNGGRIIFLPQDFGPFKNPEVKQRLPELLGLADLVYARGPVSLEMISRIVGELACLRIAPDFTALVSGKKGADVDHCAGKVCVIPNARMLDKTSQQVRRNYMKLLTYAVLRAKGAGLDVFVLNHEGAGDAQLCRELAGSFAPPLHYVGERGAREVKAIIGSAAGLITSRYHGLVSGLCQGVPSLCTSWNHKYEELCQIYDSPHSILDSTQDASCNDDRINHWLSAIHDVNHRQSRSLLDSAHSQKIRIRSMWKEVFDTLGAPASTGKRRLG